MAVVHNLFSSTGIVLFAITVIGCSAKRHHQHSVQLASIGGASGSMPRLRRFTEDGSPLRRLISQVMDGDVESHDGDAGLAELCKLYSYIDSIQTSLEAILTKRVSGGSDVCRNQNYLLRKSLLNYKNKVRF